MKNSSLNLPEKVFGVEMALIIVFVPLIVVVFIFLGSLFQIVFPRISAIKDSLASISATQNKTKDVNSKVSYIQSINQKDLNNNAQFLANSLVKEKDAYLLVKIIRRIADKYQYQIDSFSISPGVMSNDQMADAANKSAKPKSKYVEKVPVTLILIGPADKYIDFVSGIEKSLPVLSIDDLKITGKEFTSTLQLSVSAYYIGKSMEFNINSLSLADLTLSKDESEIVSRLNQFDYDKNIVLMEGAQEASHSFTKFDMRDPFSL